MNVLALLGIDLPIIQAPMAGADSPQLAAAVSESGGLGSLACALLNPEEIRSAFAAIRLRTPRPINLNFFCHDMPQTATGFEPAWKELLRPHYGHLGLDIDSVSPGRLRLPFDAATCDVVEDLAPEVVSFHFGLPAPQLLTRLRARGIKIVSSATSVAEARWLEEHGCDAVIAQGGEAGGHRAMFLETDPACQIGTMALVPQVVDAVSVPVIAAGGIGDARGVAAALMLGASAVQLGTAYLFCPEASVSDLYRGALRDARNFNTVVTNVFSGRPARGIENRFVAECGPLSDAAPPFPLASTLVGPLRAASQQTGSLDYLQMWAGQSAALGQPLPAGKLTQTLARDARRLINTMSITVRNTSSN